jgi:hypothetical protein
MIIHRNREPRVLRRMRTVHMRIIRSAPVLEGGFTLLHDNALASPSQDDRQPNYARAVALGRKVIGYTDHRSRSGQVRSGFKLLLADVWNPETQGSLATSEGTVKCSNSHSELDDAASPDEEHALKRAVALRRVRSAEFKKSPKPTAP